MLSMQVDTFSVHFYITVFGQYCHIVDIISVMRLHKNVVLLVYLLFPHKLVHSLLLRRYVDYLNDACAHCHTMSLIGKHARISRKFCHMLSMQVDTFSIQFDMTVFGQNCHIVDIVRIHNNVVSLVYLLFRHELVHSLLLSG